ncbi:H(+)/Cl(-) exchange transporter 7-like [Ruditapes philippinarum]|uniref:H(+)/Cl(-) exchange transporter 7-like n=1 Tax=Ruditapes philippinarum TaxID=129788 RepID=UPI00295AB277|nr:H(+)/Cl(-) exchange transporter 7-like [Ruditapes philippinarum]
MNTETIRKKHTQFTVTEVLDSDIQKSKNSEHEDGNKHDKVSDSVECDLIDNVDTQAPLTDTLTSSTLTARLSSKWQELSRRIKGQGYKTRFRKRLVSKWESLNFDTIENKLHQQHKVKPNEKKEILYRWLMAFFTGLLTAILASTVHILVETIGHAKFDFLQNYIDRCSNEECLWQPAVTWIVINVVVSCCGAALIVYFQPMAFGGGIPYIKSYLNGVKIPGLLTLECFLAKVGGVIMSILGGLACGKEGPMAHSGSIIAAGIGKGRLRLPCGRKRVSIYAGFLDDHETRDFVSAGAAAGVSAAFGTPVGGTLFSLEEAASFWSNALTWRVFFTAMIACFFTNLMLSIFHGTPLRLSSPGLVRFDVFPNLEFDLIEIPVYLLMAVIGGLLGAAFVVINYKLTVFRNRFVKLKCMRVLEAGLVAALAGLVSIILITNINACTNKKPYDDLAIVAQVKCPENEHHSLSTLILATPEGCLKALLNDPFDSYGAVSLSLFVVAFFFLAVLTYGLSVSRGVFIPCLVIGAAWGRLFGLAAMYILPGDKEQYTHIGKYALVGAAAQLGGVLRATISLSVMIIECTGEVSFGLPIILVLMISKWVGDFISTGLYDMNIEVLGLPLLPWDPPPFCHNVKASDIMNCPVSSFRKVERVGDIVQTLRNETFCGFPVVSNSGKVPCKMSGLILRSQLVVLLKYKVFCQQLDQQPSSVRLKDFQKYDQHLKIENVVVSDEEMNYLMDLRPYYSPSPYTIGPMFSLPRLFRLFRGLGLRHLVVVNDSKEPIGMITRKDLAKFRVESHRGLLKVEQLNIEDK